MLEVEAASLGDFSHPARFLPLDRLDEAAIPQGVDGLCQLPVARSSRFGWVANPLKHGELKLVELWPSLHGSPRRADTGLHAHANDLLIEGR